MQQPKSKPPGRSGQRFETYTHRNRKVRVPLGYMAVGLITEPQQAEEIVASGKADMVALARGILYDPHWPWHAAAALGASVDAPRQYWRSQPREHPQLFGPATSGQR